MRARKWRRKYMYIVNQARWRHGNYWTSIWSHRLPIICRGRRCRLITGKYRNGHRRRRYIISPPSQRCILLVMAALWNRADHYIFACGFFFCLFFLAYSQPSQIGCLPYFHTWCGLSANLRCRYETCCTRLAENTGRKKVAKIAIWVPSYNFVGLYLRS